MASALTDVYKKASLGSGTFVDMDTDTIKLRAINVATDYPTLNLAATVMTGITGYAGTTDQTLASGSITATVAGSTTSGTVAIDYTDPTYTAVAVSGSKTIAAFFLYKFVTNDAASVPVFYIDGFTAILPNGGDITAQFDNGNNRVFSLP